jgi:hypothetical protein
MQANGGTDKLKPRKKFHTDEAISIYCLLSLEPSNRQAQTCTDSNPLTDATTWLKSLSSKRLFIRATGHAGYQSWKAYTGKGRERNREVQTIVHSDLTCNRTSDLIPYYFLHTHRSHGWKGVISFIFIIIIIFIVTNLLNCIWIPEKSENKSVSFYFVKYLQTTKFFK